MIVEKNLIVSKFGVVIREIRISKGLTMEELACNSSMEYIQLSRIERGKINTTIFQMYKITKSLDIELSEVFKKIEGKESD